MLEVFLFGVKSLSSKEHYKYQKGKHYLVL